MPQQWTKDKTNHLATFIGHQKQGVALGQKALQKGPVLRLGIGGAAMEDWLVGFVLDPFFLSQGSNGIQIGFNGSANGGHWIPQSLIFMGLD